MASSRRPWVVRQLGPPVRIMWWWAMRARGIDVTARSAGVPSLVLAAHPDDETLGCAATIMRKRDAGTLVVLVVATDGTASTSSKVLAAGELGAIRVGETTVAGQVMGVGADEIIRLGFQDGQLAGDEAPLSRLIADLIDEHCPQEVFVTSAHDPHRDHAALGRAARLALSGPGMEGIRLLEYPIWQWRWPGSWLQGLGAPDGAGRLRALTRLRPELVSTDGCLDRKRTAMAAYGSQIGNLTGEPEWWSLDRRFLVNFYRSHELFLPVTDL